MSWSAGDNERRLHGVVRVATVTEVNAARGEAKVRFGPDAVSDWLPWTAPGAGTVSVWAPIAVGEQVVVVSPGGDTGQGVIVGSLYSAANAAPSGEAGEFVIQLGAAKVTVSGDRIELKVGGTILAIGATGVESNADLDLSGGSLTTSGTVTSAGINLTTHKHIGDSGGQTSEPQ